MSETCRGHLWEKIILKLFASSWYIFLTYIYDARSHLHQTLKSIYYVDFHSIIKYRLIFWSNSSSTGKSFTLQKKTVRIMASSKLRTTCGSLFKQLEILPIPYQYILSLMSSTINNQEIFQIHLYTILIQGINIILTGQMPTYCFQKSTVYAGINIFNLHHLVWQSSWMTRQNLKKP